MYCYTNGTKQLHFCYPVIWKAYLGSRESHSFAVVHAENEVVFHGNKICVKMSWSL